MVRRLDALLRLQEQLGYSFSSAALLLRCLTHVSFMRGESDTSNETLEFLGDAVLNLSVSDLLMRRFTDKREGDLSKMRASLVNSVILAEKATELGIDNLIRMGKGEEQSGGRFKRSILAATLEALLGGMYWEAGYETARGVVERLFSPGLGERTLGTDDHKTHLQEISQMVFRTPPTYTLVDESGPSHEKRFVTQIAIAGKVLGQGMGRTKKQSQQEAARKALEQLKRQGEAGLLS